MCTRLRATGMPLETIRRFAALVRAGTGNERSRLAILHEHERRVHRQVEELTAALDLVREKIDVYEQHLAAGTEAGLWDPTVTT